MDRKKQILNNGFKTTEVIFLIVITCIISLIMGWSISNKSNLQKTTPKTNHKELQEFIDNYNYILEKCRFKKTFRRSNRRNGKTIR